uniref:Transcriptional repressor TUP1 n=2 Tax=Noccaea caerulescens TaxID=107243 RepID=A0A1J3HX32_NOCCA
MIRCHETQEEPDSFLEHHQTSSPKALHRCITTLVGQTSSYISSLTLAGKRLYTGSNDGVVRLWNASTLETLAEASSSGGDVITGERGGGGAVKSLVILADKLFTAHQDQKIRVWKINYVVEEEEVGDKKYMHLATMPTISDRFAKCLMPKNQVEIRRHKKASWVHHVDAVSGLALSRDGTILYSVSWDRTLKIWRTTDFKCLESITNAHDDAINAVELSENGDIYTGSSDNRIKVWRKSVNEENDKKNKNKKHSLVATFSEHNSGINALALSCYNERSLLHSGGSDGSILVWERDEEGGDINVVGVLRGHRESVLCLAVISDILCSGSADKKVRLWKCSATDFSCLALLEGHRGPVKCLAGAIRDSGTQSETSYYIYSGGLDSQIKVWQVLVPTL